MPTDGTGYYRFDTRSLADRERELMKVRRTERRRQRRANRRASVVPVEGTHDYEEETHV